MSEIKDVKPTASNKPKYFREVHCQKGGGVEVIFQASFDGATWFSDEGGVAEGKILDIVHLPQVMVDCILDSE